MNKMRNVSKTIKIIELDTSKAMEKINSGRTDEIVDEDYEWIERVTTLDEFKRSNSDSDEKGDRR